MRTPGTPRTQTHTRAQSASLTRSLPTHPILEQATLRKRGGLASPARARRSDGGRRRLQPLHARERRELPTLRAAGAQRAGIAMRYRANFWHGRTQPRSAQSSSCPRSAPSPPSPPPRNAQVHRPWADFTAHLKRCATAASTAASTAAAAATSRAAAATAAASEGARAEGVKGQGMEGCYCLQLALGVRGTRTYGESVFESEMIGRDCTEELLFHVQARRAARTRARPVSSALTDGFLRVAALSLHVQDALESEPMASLLSVRRRQVATGRLRSLL